MLVTAKQLFATFALLVLFSFTEISQGRVKEPRNVIDDIFASFKEHKFRHKRVVEPTAPWPTTDDVEAPEPTDQVSPAGLSPTTDDIDVQPSPFQVWPTTDYIGVQPSPFQVGNVECGRRKSTPRIVGGTDASPGSWPWQVLVDYIGFPGAQWCGGSILTEYWIVTAAHCFSPGVNPSIYTVTVGEHDVRIFEGYEQVIPIDTIIIHPQYNRQTLDYDMALIKLKRPIQFNLNVRPVCLPTTDFAPGTNCYVTGWGNTLEGGIAAEILQQAQVPLVSRDTCQQAYNDTGFTITERMRCAGLVGGNIGTCQGDSGGGLVCPRNNKWYLMGIVSAAVGCARPNRYTIYADVLELKSWVQQTIGLRR